MVDVLKRKFVVSAVLFPLGVATIGSLPFSALAADNGLGNASNSKLSAVTSTRFVCKVESTKDGQTLYKGTILAGVPKIVAETVKGKIVAVITDEGNGILKLSLYREARKYRDGNPVHDSSFIDSSKIGDKTRMVWDGLGLSFLVIKV